MTATRSECCRASVHRAYERSVDDLHEIAACNLAVAGLHADEANQDLGLAIPVGKSHDPLDQIQQQTWELAMTQDLGQRGRMDSSSGSVKARQSRRVMSVRRASSGNRRRRVLTSIWRSYRSPRERSRVRPQCRSLM